jgi:hypothetical protein
MRDLVQDFDWVELVGTDDGAVEALSVADLEFVEQRIYPGECRDVSMAQPLLLIWVKVELHQDLCRDLDLGLSCELH